MRLAGSYAINWDRKDNAGRTLASGTYIYRLRAGEREETRNSAGSNTRHPLRLLRGKCFLLSVTSGVSAASAASKKGISPASGRS
jgi:hypothetical protein